MSESNIDRDWLVKQLRAWPKRVDPAKTTNVTVLMKAAAAALSTPEPVNDSYKLYLRSQIFAALRRHNVSEQCFADVAMITHAEPLSDSQPLDAAVIERARIEGFAQFFAYDQDLAWGSLTDEARANYISLAKICLSALDAREGG